MWLLKGSTSDRPAQAVGSNWWNEQCVFARFGDALTTRSARRRYGKTRVDWDLAFFLASALGQELPLAGVSYLGNYSPWEAPAV